MSSTLSPYLVMLIFVCIILLIFLGKVTTELTYGGEKILNIYV